MARYLKFLAAMSLVLSGCTTIPETVPVSRTLTGHYFHYCGEIAQRNGSVGYVAWLPGVATQCLVAGARTPQKAIVACNKLVEVIRTRLNIRDKCRLAYDGTRIVDPVFARVVENTVEIPVKLRIYDAYTGNLQNTDAVLAEKKSYSTNSVAFTVRAQGFDLCTGQYKMTIGGMISFNMKCFEQEFSGSAFPEKVIRQNGLIIPAPRQVQVNAGRSWMRISF